MAIKMSISQAKRLGVATTRNHKGEVVITNLPPKLKKIKASKFKSK